MRYRSSPLLCTYMCPPNTAEWSPSAKLKQCKLCYCHWNLFYVWSLCSSSSFCTAGTTATRTQIRKLISYICYPSPRIPIKLIWRLNFHMSFIKLWDCLMLTNSSQCVSNWNKRHSTDSICLEEEPDDVSQGFSPTPSRSFVKPANTKKTRQWRRSFGSNCFTSLKVRSVKLYLC